ncbi:DoxX family protein [Thermobifida cellulosilytica]|uniref:Membrane protein n=1 Tax=Thermobifida cellulosilytica TB100 TaxID=665004 RepID=A0A147KHC6_THECS|nr:DoxX family protein [Thermobifida cellulosilytica]KUP96671.1 membrane protein [Thermobifida cellulosilytica TB100]
MNLDRFREPVLALFRIVVGFMFFCHGLASLFGVLGGNQGSGQAVDFASWPGWWAALIQFVCGALVLLGLFTRGSAVLASGSMAYAYFVVHQPSALLPLNNHGELAAMYSWAFLLIAVLGPGAWALDQFVLHRGGARQRKLATADASSTR